MSVRRISVITLCLAVIACFFYVRRAPDVNYWEIKSDKSYNQIVFFGDSLVTGYGLKRKRNSYPSLVARELNKASKVYGYNGCTTEVALGRLKFVLREEASLVVVTLGGNDILQHVNLADTATNLGIIFKRLQKAGHTVVFTELLSFFDKERHQVYVDICSEAGIAIVPDIYSGLHTDSDAMQADSIHPSVVGCQIIAERVIEVIREFH